MDINKEKIKGLEIIRFVQKTFQISDDELINEISKNQPLKKAYDIKLSKTTRVEVTEEQLKEFIEHDGCAFCGSQRCFGDLESAQGCKRVLNWIETGEID
jgi:hypothetical protein